MICNSYDQLTIIEKTQLVGKLTHLIQNDEQAFKVAHELLKNAESNGLFDKVVIFPQLEPRTDNTTKPIQANDSLSLSKRSMYIPQNSHNLIDSMYNRALYTIQKSYHKLFTGLAS